MPHAETTGPAASAAAAKRRRWAAIIPAVLATIALACLAAGWLYILRPDALDTTDPVAVSQRFIVDLQDGHAGQAYDLTTPFYQKSVNRNDFSGKFAASETQTLPQSRPQFFSKATSPQGNEAQVILNLDRDHPGGDDYRAVIMLASDHGRWQVESVTTAIGKASKQPPANSHSPSS